MQQKKCGRCKQVKDISEFNKEYKCYCKECERKYSKKRRVIGKGIKKKYYAIYKGDEFICMGYKEECAEYLGVKPNTITFWTAPSYKKRAAHRKNPMLAIVVEED